MQEKRRDGFRRDTTLLYLCLTAEASLSADTLPRCNGRSRRDLLSETLLSLQLTRGIHRKQTLVLHLPTILFCPPYRLLVLAQTPLYNRIIA